MPYVGEDAQTLRKRRWDDEDDVYRVYGPDKQTDIYLVNQHPNFAPRKVMPLSKRARILNDDGMHTYDDLPPMHRRRLSLTKSTQDHYENPPSKLQSKAAGAVLLPCHICHRRPTKKSDLDSFAECLGCGERTCFVCIRQCPGWGPTDVTASSEDDVLSRSFHMDDIDDVLINRHNNPHHDCDGKSRDQDGRQDETPRNSREEDLQKSKGGWGIGGHRTMVCSRCCVEKGAEGEVMCLGCLSRMEGA
jgi:hypothetical protein